MAELHEDDIKFVVDRYSEDRFNTEKALKAFHSRRGRRLTFRRPASVIASCMASLAIMSAAGIGIYQIHEHAKTNAEQAALPPAPPAAEYPASRTFVYEGTALEQVLDELSAYYGCQLSCSEKGKHLTATFPDDGIENIIPLIEEALDTKIKIAK